MYQYRCTLERVIDGDTVDLGVDLGFRIHVHTRFRLAGIDAPELRGETSEAGAASKIWLVEILENATLLMVKSTRGDKYGRWLADIWADGVNVNEEMVALGYAVRW